MNYLTLQGEREVCDYFSSLNSHSIALDIEGEYNLHVYGEKLCLIQIYDGSDFVIIDPFDFDKETLAGIFEQQHVAKVMYDASSDLSLLKNGYDIACPSIIDLKAAVDLLGHRRPNLYAVLETYLAVRLGPKKQYQTYNWTKRPIAHNALRYALNDVKYLLELKEVLMERLDARGLVEEFFLKNSAIQHKDYTRSPGTSIRRTRGFLALSPAEKKQFESIFAIREKYAKALNKPPNNVITNHELLRIAKNPEQLKSMRFSGKLESRIIHAIRHEMNALVHC